MVFHIFAVIYVGNVFGCCTVGGCYCACVDCGSIFTIASTRLISPPICIDITMMKRPPGPFRRRESSSSICSLFYYTLIPLFIVVRFWYIKKVNEANKTASAGQEVKIVLSNLSLTEVLGDVHAVDWRCRITKQFLFYFIFFQIDGGKFKQIKNSPLLFLAVILKIFY